MECFLFGSLAKERRHKKVGPGLSSAIMDVELLHAKVLTTASASDSQIHCLNV